MDLINPNARNEVFKLILNYNLMDCWRENHLENKEYTWFRKNPVKKARLDFFLISESLFTEVSDTKILPGYRTDHSLIYTSFEFGKFKKGTSYWKFNNSLLKEIDYVNEIKKVIKDIKIQYATNLPNEIDDIPPQDLNFNINDQLFFETLLIAIRGKTIAFSSHKKKVDLKKENTLMSEIEQLEKKMNIDYDLLDTKKEELLELRRKKMEGVAVRSKAKWIQDGEKPSKYFCNLENRNYVSKFMNMLITKDGVCLKTQDEILLETKRHYHNLYKSKETENISLHETLTNMNFKKLSEEQQKSIEGNITYSEMLNSLKRMSNNTSPGNDGFTVEFYKFFWSDIGIFLVRSVNYSYLVRELSVTQKQGVITCIPKGNKDKLYLKNWRPISLLNVSYKIASSSIAFRIKNILDNIINEDQTGFLPGRLMATNIRTLYDILFYTEKHNIPGLLLLIDFAAAFDTISWNFMNKVLEFFNFGPSVRRWVNLFYTNIESCVIVNGHMSDWFMLQRGCRQGDALSPYLFIICAEILAILLRNNPKIKGININGKEYIVSQYADDTSLTLDGSQESLLNTMLVLKFYGRISGLNVNTDKTKVIWFGARKNSNIILCPEYNLSWENTVFTVLGIRFSTDLTDIVNLNYDPKIEEIKQLFACWSKRIISPMGKIVVIKTLALAKLNHLILGIPNPSKEKIKLIQSLFFKFLWNINNDKVKRSIITQDYNAGGLKMIDLQTFIHSLKLTWLRRISEMNNKFSHLVESLCPVIKTMYKFGSDYLKVRLLHQINPFWKDVLLSYIVLAKTLKPKNVNFCQSVHIWYNPDIRVGGSSVGYKRWISAGILFIGDLLNSDGEFYSYRELTRCFNVRTNFLEFNGIIRAIKQFLNNEGFNHGLFKSVNPLIPITLLMIKKDQKGCRNVYKLLRKPDELPKSHPKWINDLNNSAITTINRNESFFGIVYKLTQDPKLLWFQYRFNHRILATNYLLVKMNLKDNNMCTFCRNAPESLLHLFWTCEISKQFWSNLNTYISNTCNIDFPEWCAYEILFGSLKLDLPLGKILLEAKHFLYYCRVKSTMPSVENFKRQIVLLYQSEKYVAKRQFQFDKFNKMWEKYKALIN